MTDIKVDESKVTDNKHTERWWQKELVNTVPYGTEMLQELAAHKGTVEKFKPHFVSEFADKAISINPSDIADFLQQELERRFIGICEALEQDFYKTYSDTILITEAIARYKEVYYIMERLNIPIIFVFNLPEAYSNRFAVDEKDILLALHDNRDYISQRVNEDERDGFPLRGYLESLNNAELYAREHYAKEYQRDEGQ